MHYQDLSEGINLEKSQQQQPQTPIYGLKAKIFHQNLLQEG